MLTFFVTASGTELGKTFVTAGLLRAYRAAGRKVAAIKPVMSGFDPADLASSDAGRILEAAGGPVTPESVDAIAPWRFLTPISPDMAAAREGREIDFDTLLHFCRQARTASPDVLLIEAAGGVMAPLSPTRTMLDWAAELSHPALLVAGTYLGAISHALTAQTALRARGLPVAALIVSESGNNPVPPDETRASLARHLPETQVCLLRRGAGAAAFGSLAASLTQR